MGLYPSAPARRETSPTRAQRALRFRTPEWSLAGPGFLYASLLLVLVIVAIVAVAFASMPVVPGVDPGHWLSISYSYVGQPTAPDPTDRPLYYSPLLFPFLGSAVVVTGSPLVAADVVAIGLFAVYGLSLVHLARRYLISGPMQLALVGLAIFAGTTIQMLFWGGYPNLLGFILMNEAFIFLLRFVRTKATTDGALFYTLIALTYLGHDLSFAVLLAAVVTAGFFLLVFRKIAWRFVLRPVNLLGLVGVGAVIGTYSLVTARLGIPHPSYFRANPAAYFIDEIGEMFAPLARDPLLFPYGAKVYLPPVPTALLLAAAPLVALLTLAIVRWRVPGRVDTRLMIAGAWLAAACMVPGVGYLLHVETDFTRFLYFLPLPFYLVTLAALERGFFRQLVAGTPAAPAASGVKPRRAGPRSAPPPSRVGFGATIAVFVVLLLVLVTVTLPVVQGNESAGTATAHDAPFVSAMTWLKGVAGSGNVLTVPSAARWVEALSDRDAYTIGPEWLLFDPFQIQNAQEAYWALTSDYATTNEQVAFSYSGFASPVMSQAPMYTAYIEGVPFPIVRVLPGSLVLNATGPGGTFDYAMTATSTPVLGSPSSNGLSVLITYRSTAATLLETSTVSVGGTATITFTVQPAAGYSVHTLSMTLSEPPTDSTTLSTDPPSSVVPNGATLVWTVSGPLGQYPTPVTVTTDLGFAPAPSSAHRLAPGDPYQWVISVNDVNGPAPFSETVAFATAGTSNPSNPLPSVVSSAAFFASHGIRFLVWPNQQYGSVEITYYEAQFGFLPVFTNSEWVILQSPG
jgi:hypothetical protein